MPTHNATGWGADVDALFDLAAFLETQKSHFEAAQRKLLSDVRTVEWFGPDAEDFRKSVTKYSDLKLTVSCGSLDALAKHLRENATAQGVTSAVGSGNPLSDFVIGVGIVGSDIIRRAELRHAQEVAWDDDLVRRLPNLINASPVEVQAWWNSLTAQQQEYYLKNHNADLLQLRNMPPEFQRLVEDEYRQSRASQIPVSSESGNLHGELKVRSIRVSADLGGTVTEFADGHAEVTLHIGGEIGALLSAKAGSGVEGSISVGAGLSQTYSFKSRAEADAFLEGLKQEALKIDDDARAIAGGLLKGGVPGAVGTLVASQVADLSAYLDRHDRVSNEVDVHVAGQVSVNLGEDAKFDLSGKAGIKVDTDAHTTKVYVETEAGVSAKAFGINGSAKASIAAEFTTAGQGGEAGELKLTASIQGSGDGDLKKILNSVGPDQSDVMKGQQVGGFRATVSATINTKDPEMKPLVEQYLRAKSSGDSGAESTALQQLYAKARVQIRVDSVGSSEKSHLGGMVTETKEVTHAQIVIEKPQGGKFINMLTGSH